MGQRHIAAKEARDCGVERNTNRPVVHRLHWKCKVDRIVEEGTAIGMLVSQGKVVSMCNEGLTWVRGIVRSEMLLTQCKMAKEN